MSMPEFSLIFGVGPFAVVKAAMLLLVAVAIVVLVLISMYRHNRLLFWCLAGALAGHVLFAGGLYAAGILLKPRPKEQRVAISFIKVPPPPKENKEIPPPPKALDIPLGSLSGNRNAKKMPKGTRLDVKKPGAPKAPGRPMVSGLSDDGVIPIDEKDKGLFSGTFKDVIDTKDITTLASGGNGGENAGTPDGEGSGDVPAGFPDGKIGGRVYFIRLKHGSGAWNAYDDGTKRLLGFLNQFFPCESESRAMTTAEMRERFMNKGAQPTFLYVYCDDSFSLSSTDVTILREYMDRGGFLFLDSRPLPDIRSAVSRELDKVLPGCRLAALPNSHPINSFLFRLARPGYGENYAEQRNYGVSRGGRLVAFYSMGNLSHIYASFDPKADEYYTAQYQMGANVMLYAIRKGNTVGIDKRAGANASITTQTLERLGMLEPTGKTPAEGGKPPESVKVKPTKPPGSKPGTGDDVPDDIKLLDQ